MRIHQLLFFLPGMVIAAACASASPPPAPSVSPSSPSLFASPSPAPSAPAVSATASPAQPGFRLAVIADSVSEPVGPDQVQAVVKDANQSLLDLTGYAFLLSDFVTDDLGGSTTEMVNRYMQAHASGLPDGVLIFSHGDNGQARQTGGYGYVVPGPQGYRNRFDSPVSGNDKIYVAVVDLSYRYAGCGYGGDDAPRSSVSIDGECSRQPGTPCVQHNGYSMCSNAVGDLYSSTPSYYAARMAIHEILHFFSPDGDQDHYATPNCNAKMGWPQGFYDNIEAEYHNDWCPFVYENFVKSYQP